jgi:hypothetical protein
LSVAARWNTVLEARRRLARWIFPPVVGWLVDRVWAVTVLLLIGAGLGQK